MIKINMGILKEQLNRSKELMGIITEQDDTLETLDVNDVFEADINSMGNRPGYIKGKVISEELNRMNKKRGMRLSLKVDITEVYQAPSTLIKGDYTMKIIVGDAAGGMLINPETEETFKLDSIHKETKDWTGTTQGEETGGKLGKLKKFAKKIMRESTINEASLPPFNVDNGLLNINNKRYKLQSEKAWTRWDIDIEDIAVEDNGDVNLTVLHPLSGKSIKSQIRKVNFDKVIRGAKNNEEEITVENLEGKEFYLVRV